MNLSECCKDYLTEQGYSKKEVENFLDCTVHIAMAIAQYAHRNQKRLNGDPYYYHCYNCLSLYREFVGITEDDPFCIDVDLMYEYGIPFDGVQETCLLHDVLEDTDVSLDEIYEMFSEYGYELYFNANIKKPLLAVTHDKKDNYDKYIEQVLQNDIAAMVKLMDLTDNSNLLTLDSFGEKEYERAHDYVRYFGMIDVVTRYIEKVRKYREAFRKESVE